MREYKKFTEKRKGKNVIPLLNSVCGVDLPHWTIETASDIRSYLSGNAVDRFSELEDKIENGTLIERPPIKKGDWVYVIHRHKGIRFDDIPYFEKRIVLRYVEKIFLNNDNTFTISTIAITTYGSKSRSILKSTTFNKTWFLTKAEAEQNLKS